MKRSLMSSVSITKLYNLLSLKIGKEPAEVLTSYIEEKIKDEFSDRSQLLATKLDLANTNCGHYIETGRVYLLDRSNSDNSWYYFSFS